MGQKIHPIGFRIGVIRDWESKWYLDKGYADAIYEDHRIRTYIKKNHENAAISRVEIERPGGPTRQNLYHVGDLVFFPTGVPNAKIAFARAGSRITQLTVADPEVMLTARRE